MMTAARGAVNVSILARPVMHPTFDPLDDLAGERPALDAAPARTITAITREPLR
jgi:hypothetical protein